ncbi:MAG TPA: DUF5615 family PIN-like protein [Chitinophagaceae bacterium]|nr:DUF5615 family PIN-like protein [Chitinophagaceae bacterium]
MEHLVVADESVDYRIVTQLRNAGIEVYSITEEKPSLKDQDVLQIAYEKKALLITEDKDFGELVFRLQLPHTGILLIREGDHKISSVINAIKLHYEKMINKFSVIKNKNLRIKY